MNIKNAFKVDWNKESIENSLSMRVSEVEMLTKTMNEMLKNDCDQQSLDAIKLAIDESMMDIKNLKNLISQIVLDEEKDNSTAESYSATSYDFDTANDSVEKVTNNRFIGTFEKSVGIPSTMIKSVTFDDDKTKMISVTLYNFVDGNGKPLIQTLKNAPNDFLFTLLYYNAYGESMFCEYFSKCNITGIFRDSISYDNEDYSLIHIFLTYDEVNYG